MPLQARHQALLPWHAATQRQPRQHAAMSTGSRASGATLQGAATSKRPCPSPDGTLTGGLLQIWSHTGCTSHLGRSWMPWTCLMPACLGWPVERLWPWTRRLVSCWSKHRSDSFSASSAHPHPSENDCPTCSHVSPHARIHVQPESTPAIESG